MHSTMSIKAMISLYFWNKIELSFCNFHCRLQIEIKSFWSSESSVHLWKDFSVALRKGGWFGS